MLYQHFLLFLLGICLFSCTPKKAEQKVVTAARPERIISLMPAATETLFALGAGQRIIGATKNCDFPAAATLITRIGGALPKTTNIEQILTLEPDLVIVTGEGQQPLLDELGALNIDIRMSLTVSIEDAFKTVSTIGDWIGEPDRAARINAINRQVIAMVADKVRGLPKPKIFYQVWDDPLMTAGPPTFLGQLLEIAGGKNIFSDIDKTYPIISNEDVLDRNPDMILGPSYHLEPMTIAAMKKRPGWTTINAIKNETVHILDGQLISRPGPRIGEALTAIAQKIHPEVDFSDAVALSKTVFTDL